MQCKVGQSYLGEKLDMHRRLPENAGKLLFCKGNYEREVGGMGMAGLLLNFTHSELAERGSLLAQFLPSHGIASLEGTRVSKIKREITGDLALNPLWCLCTALISKSAV